MIKKLFLNEKIILSVIFLNTLCILLLQCGVGIPWLDDLDVFCTLFFLFEMIVKHRVYGLKGYWTKGWNVFDGMLVVLSLPSLAYFFFPDLFTNSSVVLVLRLLRVMRYFRLFHFFPGFTRIVSNFALALRESFGLIVGLVLVMFICSLMCCSFFGKYVPEMFGTPWDSLYSIFRVFTGEGWNEIPDTIASVMGGSWSHIVRIFFSVILLLCCILGMSLLNSVFVDAMVADNNDEILDHLEKMQQQIDRMEEMLKNQHKE